MKTTNNINQTTTNMLKITNKELSIVNQWVSKNVKLHPNINYKINFKDIHKKFEKDTNNQIAKTAFGSYFKYAILLTFKKDPIIVLSQGTTSYFGLEINEIEGSYHYFNILTRNRELLAFDYFTEEKILNWFKQCVVLPSLPDNQGSTTIRTRELCQNYLYYYDISAPIDRGMINNFGLLFKKTIIDHNIPIAYSKPFKLYAGYAGIQGLLVKKHDEKKYKKHYNTPNTPIEPTKNFLVISKFHYILLGISLSNFVLLGFIVYNNFLL